MSAALSSASRCDFLLSGICSHEYSTFLMAVLSAAGSPPALIRCRAVLAFARTSTLFFWRLILRIRIPPLPSRPPKFLLTRLRLSKLHIFSTIAGDAP